jgi:5'-nucleotidase
MRQRSYRRALAILACALIATACSTSDETDATLHIVVTNDDGVHAPGIDVLVQTLGALPDVEVRVIAPADDRSGTGETRSAGELIGTITTTASGYPAVAVVGYPADTLSFASRRRVLATADVVVSGVNWGENLGPVIARSGTIGAARAAVRLGVPALAVSQGGGDPPDFETGAALAADWLQDHRVALLSDSAPLVVTSINVPTCVRGEPRGLRTLPVAADAAGPESPGADCDSTKVDVLDDLDGFLNGFATLSTFDSDLHPVR